MDVRLAAAYGMTPEAVDELHIRDAVVMQVAALRRRREAWAHTSVLAASVQNLGRSPGAPAVSPADILDAVMGGGGGMTDAEVEEARELVRSRRERDQQRKRRKEWLKGH